MLRKILLLLLLLPLVTLNQIQAQTNPAITEWLINTTGITSRHYEDGNSTPINDNEPANVQKVQYSNDYAYINCSGLPAYLIGPYLDNNPSQASNNDNLFKIPLNPTPNTGTLTPTPLGSNGVFINGVSFYNYADGVSYSQTSGQDERAGGDGIWNRNAIFAEAEGFDCAKGHPSPIFSGNGPNATLEGGFYHHHQNPTAFNLDLVNLSTICDLYLADGLYTIDSAVHSPLIGFAFDGYPVYGAYGYANSDGTGGITRITSSYQETTTTTRTNGPNVSTTYPVGWYKEDYAYVSNSGHLDEHNGRDCVTPEYPNGTYAYFATVDENWNSAYPYIVGPNYYGIVERDNFNGVTINETVTEYGSTTSTNEKDFDNIRISVFPNPASDLVAIQINGILKSDLKVEMFDLNGKRVKQTTINQGSTIWHLDTQTLYAGTYSIQITNGKESVTEKLVILK